MPSLEPGAKPHLRDMPHWVLKCRSLGQILADSGQVGAGGQLDQDVACGQPAATATAWSYPTQGWESTSETARMSHGLASTLKFGTWEMQSTHHTLIGNCCCFCPSAPRCGYTEEPLSLPWPITASREEGRGTGGAGGGWGDTASKGSVPPPSAHKFILVIQMRSGHNGGGPVLNKEPLGITAATSLGTTQTGLCEQEAVHTQAPRNAQQSPAGEVPWGHT